MSVWVCADRPEQPSAVIPGPEEGFCKVQHANTHIETVTGHEHIRTRTYRVGTAGRRSRTSMSPLENAQAKLLM